MGLLLLPLLAASAITGALIWWQITSGAGTGRLLISAHVYLGLVGLPLMLAKLVAGVIAWRRRTARGRPARPRTAHLMTALLVLATLIIYGSGTLLYVNVVSGGILKSVHLWSAIAVVPLVTDHLWRFLRRAHTVVRHAVRRAEPSAALLTRRQVLLTGAAALVAWGGVRLVGGVATGLERSGPNDFPVTLTSGGQDQPNSQTWRLTIDGDVGLPTTLSLADLRDGPVESHRYSLDCVQGWSATRTWGGIPLQHLLTEAHASDQLISVVVRSTTGYEVALLREQVEDPRTLVAWQVDGVDLTPEHGFPARIMAPGVIGEYCVKWVDSLTIVSA